MTSPNQAQFFRKGTVLAADGNRLNKLTQQVPEGDIIALLEGYARQSRRPEKDFSEFYPAGSATTSPEEQEGSARGAAATDHIRAPWNIWRRQGLRVPWVKFAISFAVSLVSVPVLAFFAPGVSEPIAATVAQLIPDWAYSEVAEGVACARTTPVYDGSGDFQGRLRASGCERTTYISAPVSIEDARAVEPAFVAIEGEMTGRGIMLNVNLVGIGRGIANGFAVGGTNPVQSAIESSMGKSHALGLFDKVYALGVIGPAFTADHLGSDDAKLLFAVDNLQCAIGAPGSAFGPALAGGFCSALFSKPSLADLNAGEACIYAATLRNPLEVPASTQGELAITRYRAEFEQIKERARIKCAPKLEAPSDVIAQIDAARLPRPEQLRDLTDGIAATLPFATRLFSEFGVDTAAPSFATTLDADIQRPLVANALQFGRNIEGLLDPQLCWSETCGDNRADVAVAVFAYDETGLNIIGGYESRHGLLGGPADGMPHRSVGSLTKTLIVPLLLDAGITRLCRQPWGELHDADGYAGAACQGPKDYLSIAQALAISSNLAIADGLRQVPSHRLRAYLSTLGYAVHGDLSDAALIRSVVTGEKVAASPLVVVRDYAGLMFAETGITLPTIDGESAPATMIQLSSHASLTAIEEARAIASAPLIEPAGTVHSALPSLQGAGCTGLFAKSGTSDSVQPLAHRDKLVVLGGTCGGRQLIALALVGSPDIRIAVGDISTAQVAGLAAAAIKLATEKGN